MKLEHEGDSDAIAALMTQKLEPHGIQVKAQFKDTCLQLLLEAPAVPNRTAVIKLVRQEIAFLPILTVQSIQLYGRKLGEHRPCWTETLDIQECLAALDPEAPNPSTPVPDPDSLLAPSLGDLRLAAYQGDKKAMLILLHRAVQAPQSDPLDPLAPDSKGLTSPQSHLSEISVIMDWRDRNLDILLEAPVVPDQEQALTLITQEVKAWKLGNLQTLTLAGKQIDHPQPAWRQVLVWSSGSEQGAASSAVRMAHSPAIASRPSSPMRIPQEPITSETWRTMGIGLVLGLLIVNVSFVSYVLYPLLIILHELGHTCFAWLFGYPALPAFDFIYGGGVTLNFSRTALFIVWLVIGVLAFLLYQYRKNVLTSRVLLASLLVYILCASTSLHNILILAMGHGFELLFAGVFLYRALSGFGVQYSFERPLYAGLGFFGIFYNIRFAHRLITNSEARDIYFQGKAGIDNDFVRLAREYFHVDLSIVAILFLLSAIATLFFVFWLYSYRRIMDYLFVTLTRRSS